MEDLKWQTLSKRWKPFEKHRLSVLCRHAGTTRNGSTERYTKTITLSRTVRDITLGEYPTARTPLLSGFSKASKGNLPQNSSPPQQKKEQNQTTSSQNVSTPVPTTPKKHQQHQQEKCEWTFLVLKRRYLLVSLVVFSLQE